MGDYGHPYDVSTALDYFEENLTDRWQQTIHDAVLAMEPLAYPLHMFKANATGQYNDLIWDHRNAETYGHVTLSLKHGGCAFMNWYEDGRSGKVTDVSCPGTIWVPGDPETTVYWEGAEREVPETTTCRIGELFASAEEWAYQDRKYIFDILPPFDNQNLVTLQVARDTLVEMAGDFGAVAQGEDAAFQQSFTLSDGVSSLFGDRDEEKDWRADWTGTAADRVAEGIFASTKPTLFNHAVIANGLATLINERATIIHTYRVNTLDLIGAASAALKETSTETTDLVPGWRVVQGIGMALSIHPEAAPVGATITLVGWLGEQFLGELTEVSFDNGPAEVAIGLYDEVLRMKGGLGRSEEEYAADVAGFRAALNAVPSTFLELYDLTENSPTGTH